MSASKRPALISNIHWFSPRLVSNFEEIRSKRTTIITAPSGYGKTTLGERLFLEISKKTPEAVRIWHTSLGGSANSVWRYFCATIGKIDVSAGSELLSLGPPDPHTRADIAYVLANIVTKKTERKIWLFLDDFQNLERVTGIEVWKEFFRHRAENLHVVILARQFGDGDLRGGPDVVWLDFADLTLREDEVKGFFDAGGVRITKKQASVAQKLTNGCIQGLRLEMDRYAETGEFSVLGNEYAYHEMIRVTIWKGLSEEQKDFLLRVSPFESYTLEQAAFLLELSESEGVNIIPQYAMDVSNDRAFVQRIATDIYYNPHSRILDFCRAELEKKANLREETLTRAAEWCLMSGNPADAIVFYCMGGNYDKALSVDILGHEIWSPPGMTYEEIVVGIVRNSSREVKMRYPIHMLKHAFNLLDVGRGDVFATTCEEMSELLESADLPEDEKGRLFGELKLLSSFGEYNNISKMASLMRQAHKLAGGRPSLISMKDTWTFGNASVLFMYHSRSGRLDEELTEMKEGCGYYFALTDGHGSGGDLLMEAEALFNRGDVKNAAKTARRSFVQAEAKKQVSVCIGACLTLAGAAVINGDAEELLLMRRRIAEYSRSGLKSDRQEAEMVEFWITSLIRGAPSGRHWREPPTSGRIQVAPYMDVLRGKYLISGAPVTGTLETGGAEKWLVMAERALETARFLNCVMGEIYCHIFSACALLTINETKHAESELRAALSLAMPDLLHMPFAEHFSQLSLLPLKEVIPGKALSEIRLLAERLETGKNALLRQTPKLLPSELSEYEYNVAFLASLGYSNPEIAGRLNISRDTVKYHLKNAFIKTGVTKREDLERALFSKPRRRKTGFNLSE